MDKIKRHIKSVEEVSFLLKEVHGTIITIDKSTYSKMSTKARIKWDWFKTQFPTAELWDKAKLKDMGIL